MDIEKERKAFEAIHRNARVLRGAIFKDGEYVALSLFDESSKELAAQLNYGWSMWQAAKAHEAKKLEGCVVVPVQCPDPDFADMLFDELRKNAFGEFGDDLLIHLSDIDEEKIWALMVEAAKAQAVPDGFVVVSQKDLLELTIAINAVDLATHTESKTNEVRGMWQQVALKLMALGTAQEQKG